MSELHWQRTIDGGTSKIVVIADDYGIVQITTEALAQLLEQAGWTAHD